MSVDSERMLKLENKVKELETYINKIVGAVKSDAHASIESLKKSVTEIKVYNKAKVIELESQKKEFKNELKSDSCKTLNKLNNALNSFNLLVKNSKSETDKQITYNKKSNDDAIQSFTIKINNLMDSQEKRLLVKLALPIVELKEAPKIDMKHEIQSVVTKEYINSMVTKEKPHVIDVKGEIESVVNKQYINAIYRNK